MQDRVPLIFLTGCVDAADAETYTHQVFDHQAMLRPVVKGSFRLAHGAVGAGIAKAIALATSGQPGPVHVDVPIGVAEAMADEAPVPPAATAAPACRRPARCATRWRRWRRRNVRWPSPGSMRWNEAAGPAISRFCREHAIPLITTYKGKGLMDEADLLCLGAPACSEGRPRADAADGQGRLHPAAGL